MVLITHLAQFPEERKTRAFTSPPKGVPRPIGPAIFRQQRHHGRTSGSFLLVAGETHCGRGGIDVVVNVPGLMKYVSLPITWPVSAMRAVTKLMRSVGKLM